MSGGTTDNARDDREGLPPTSLNAPGALNQLTMLQSLVMDAPLGFGLIDREWRFVIANPRLANIVGIQADAFIGRHVAEVAPEFWPTVRPHLEAVLESSAPVEQEVDGLAEANANDVKHWRVTYYPVREGAAIIGVGVVVKDITASVRHRDALRVRTDLYAMMSRTNRAVIECRSRQELFDALCRIAVESGHFRFAWIGVPDGDTLEAVSWAGDGHAHLPAISLVTDDPAALGPTGQAFTSGEPVVVNDFLRSPETAPWHALATRAGFASAAAFPLKERVRPVAILTLRSEQVGFFTPDLVETLNEITPAVSLALDGLLREADLKRDDAELRLKDRAIRAASQGICIADALTPDYPLMFVSPGFERITGYTADEVMGHNCRLLQGPETDVNAVALVRDSIAQAQPCTVELLNYRKDGKTFLNELTISPVVDEHGVTTNFVGVLADVTERRRLEHQIQRVEKMEAVGQLASGVAHDFNNLLTVINGCGELLLDALAPEDVSRDLVQEICKAGAHGGTLTRQLLAFSRRQVVTPKRLDLNDVVRDSEKMLRRLIGEDVLLTTRLHTPLWAVTCDPGQMEQVLINLAVNARDAMPTGGRLTVSTANMTVSHAIGEVSSGDYVTLEVRDTGTGMDEDTRQHMFEPFFTTKLPGHGTGLGLSTVHGIVMRSGGRIVVESEIGHGTAFCLYLPGVDTVTDAVAPTASATEMPVGFETLLLVEDDAAVRALGHRLLTRLGYMVLYAGDGKQALDVARTFPGPIHLLISDVVMPHVGGRELALELHALRPDCKVMFVSGYTDDEVIRYGVVQSEVAFLQKPYSAAALAQKVRAVLDGRH